MDEKSWSFDSYFTFLWSLLLMVVIGTAYLLASPLIILLDILLRRRVLTKDK